MRWVWAPQRFLSGQTPYALKAILPRRSSLLRYLRYEHSRGEKARAQGLSKRNCPNLQLLKITRVSPAAAARECCLYDHPGVPVPFGGLCIARPRCGQHVSAKTPPDPAPLLTHRRPRERAHWRRYAIARHHHQAWSRCRNMRPNPDLLWRRGRCDFASRCCSPRSPAIVRGHERRDTNAAVSLATTCAPIVTGMGIEPIAARCMFAILF